jgi:hypothetical protein
MFEVRGGDRLKIEALPGSHKRENRCRADMNVEFIEAPKRSISTPGIIIP